MSYQFEDDSALEKLLTQQLDRRKLQPTIGPRSSSSRPATARLASTVQHQLVNATLPASTSVSSTRPSTGVNNQSSSADDVVPLTASASARTKLASWLAKDSTKQVGAIQADEVTDQPEPKEAIDKGTKLNSASIGAIGEDRESEELINKWLKEDRLQEMSKQRLIQLILSQILPTMVSMRDSIGERSMVEFERIKGELERERNRAQITETRLLEQAKLAEASWLQLNRQLELRLEDNERQMKEITERSKSYVNKLEEEHKDQLGKLAQGYQEKLAEERQQFEETLKRREEFHKLQLDSKLKINCELVNLEAIFGQWQTMIKTTITELDVQFKSVESLLSKQTIVVNATNLELTKKSANLSEQLDKFGGQNEQVSELVKQVRDLLPELVRNQEDNETVVKRVNEQLGELIQQNADLKLRELELSSSKEELVKEKALFEKERFQLALDQNRLTFTEQRLNELLRNNEELETKLTDQRRQQSEREIQLDGLRANLDSKSNQLKEQNYELHVTRKRLASKQEELEGLELSLEESRKSLSSQQARVVAEISKLNLLRERARRESGQLRRLRKSLVCSLCLERIFAHDLTELKDSDPIGAYDDSPLTFEDQQAAAAKSVCENKGANMKQFLPGLRTQESSKQKPCLYKQRQLNDLLGRDFDRELARLSERTELDGDQLDAESKYVDLLAIHG